MIVTVLGSCIAACIFERVLGLGGMNHFMLPGEDHGIMKNRTNTMNFELGATRYGSIAMERLINDILKLGGQRSNLEVKIFGGGRITDTSLDIGAGNISFVREYLKMENIDLVNEDVGGESPRKVYYIPASNEAFVKKIRSISNKAIHVRENAYVSRLNDGELNGEICFLQDIS